MAGTNGNGHANGNGRDKQRRKKTPHDEAVRPTDEETEIRVSFCFNLLAEGVKPWKVREAFCKKFDVHPRTAARYLSRARDLIAQQIKVPLVELKNESLALYRSVSVNRKRKLSDRLRARALLDDLLGLKSPREHWHSGPKGGEIPVPAGPPQLIVNVVTAVNGSHPEPAVKVIAPPVEKAG